MSIKKILIINTGGTISSVKTSHGFVPKRGYLEKNLPKILGLSHPEMPIYDVHEYNPLLDSSNMTLEQWNLIAEDIANNYERYDGFVILHGTDTMAYTASALSFMLENLAKPVVLTGSQIPLSEARNDAVDNLEKDGPDKLDVYNEAAGEFDPLDDAEEYSSLVSENYEDDDDMENEEE